MRFLKKLISFLASHFDRPLLSGFAPVRAAEEIPLAEKPDPLGRLLALPVGKFLSATGQSQRLLLRRQGGGELHEVEVFEIEEREIDGEWIPCLSYRARRLEIVIEDSEFMEELEAATTENALQKH